MQIFHNVYYSVRHNLSLMSCFNKLDRAPNGRGNYWGIGKKYQVSLHRNPPMLASIDQIWRFQHGQPNSEGYVQFWNPRLKWSFSWIVTREDNSTLKKSSGMNFSAELSSLSTKLSLKHHFLCELRPNGVGSHACYRQVLLLWARQDESFNLWTASWKVHRLGQLMRA